MAVIRWSGVHCRVMSPPFHGTPLRIQFLNMKAAFLAFSVYTYLVERNGKLPIAQFMDKI